MNLTKDDFEYHHGFSEKEVEQILKNQKIIEQLEHWKKHPQAFNYAQFEVWVTDILNGGNGFPMLLIPDVED